MQDKEQRNCQSSACGREIGFPGPVKRQLTPGECERSMRTCTCPLNCSCTHVLHAGVWKKANGEKTAKCQAIPMNGTMTGVYSLSSFLQGVLLSLCLCLLLCTLLRPDQPATVVPVALFFSEQHCSNVQNAQGVYGCEPEHRPDRICVKVCVATGHADNMQQLYDARYMWDEWIGSKSMESFRCNWACNAMEVG